MQQCQSVDPGYKTGQMGACFECMTLDISNSSGPLPLACLQVYPMIWRTDSSGAGPAPAAAPRACIAHCWRDMWPRILVVQGCLRP